MLIHDAFVAGEVERRSQLAIPNAIMITSLMKTIWGNKYTGHDDGWGQMGTLSAQIIKQKPTRNILNFVVLSSCRCLQHIFYDFQHFGFVAQQEKQQEKTSFVIWFPHSRRAFEANENIFISSTKKY